MFEDACTKEGTACKCFDVFASALVLCSLPGRTDSLGARDEETVGLRHRERRCACVIMARISKTAEANFIKHCFSSLMRFVPA